jgi:hypothetical protein
MSIRGGPRGNRPSELALITCSPRAARYRTNRRLARSMTVGRYQVRRAPIGPRRTLVPLSLVASRRCPLWPSFEAPPHEMGPAGKMGWRRTAARAAPYVLSHWVIARRPSRRAAGLNNLGPLRVLGRPATEYREGPRRSRQGLRPWVSICCRRNLNWCRASEPTKRRGDRSALALAHRFRKLRLPATLP